MRRSSEHGFPQSEDTCEPPEYLRARIMACTDTEQSATWFERAVVAESLAAILDL
ncbi:hypothetical protein [Nocardia brasiliensis]|uniref:hypothetical protein n=1 Tax=Nocardia brasiliensis TaxID=37326 RepID=UPI0024588F81|nr:hypothetical protein [Nocardia brasiliensis]